MWRSKTRAACAQSFTLWQQATIEMTPLLLVRATYTGVVFHANPVCGELRIEHCGVRGCSSHRHSVKLSWRKHWQRCHQI